MLGAEHASATMLEDAIAEQELYFQFMHLQSACRVNRMLTGPATQD